MNSERENFINRNYSSGVGFEMEFGKQQVGFFLDLDLTKRFTNREPGTQMTRDTEDQGHRGP